MSLLTIAQAAADRIGIPQPTSLVGSSDQNARMMLSLANQEGKALSRRFPWQRCTMEQTFATVASTVAYDLPDDFDRIVEGSIWNRTQTRPVIGPVTAQRWQMMQAQAITATWQAVYIRSNQMLFTPTPTAADTIGYEYVSKYWCGAAASTEPEQEAWAADTDVAYLDEECLTLGLIWRFLRAKGLDYGEAFRSYELEVNSRMANDGGQRILDLSSEPGYGVFAPFIEDGNWSIT